MGRVKSLCKGPYVSPTYADPQRTLALAHGQGQGCPLEWDSIYSPQPRKALKPKRIRPSWESKEETPILFILLGSGQGGGCAPRDSTWAKVTTELLLGAYICPLGVPQHLLRKALPTLWQ